MKNQSTVVLNYTIVSSSTHKFTDVYILYGLCTRSSASIGRNLMGFRPVSVWCESYRTVWRTLYVTSRVVPLALWWGIAFLSPTTRKSMRTFSASLSISTPARVFVTTWRCANLSEILWDLTGCVYEFLQTFLCMSQAVFSLPPWSGVVSSCYCWSPEVSWICGM